MSSGFRDELELFINEAARLTTRSFYRDFHNVEVCISNDEKLENAPSEEQMEAYVLHVRKFFQKNDRVCIHNINSHLLINVQPTSKSLRSWKQVYACFNDMMNSRSIIGRVNIPGAEYAGEINLLQIFKVKTYGDLAHSDRAKREKHNTLSATKNLASLYRFEYFNLLMECGELISEMANICRKILLEISANSRQTD